jgi:hypothetical protein
MLRLPLTPAWVRFLVWAIATGVLFGAEITLKSHSFVGLIFSGLGFGVFLAAFLVYQTRGMQKAATQAVAGLDDAELSHAIDAVLRGVMPDNSECGPQQHGLVEPSCATTRPRNSNARNDRLGYFWDSSPCWTSY